MSTEIGTVEGMPGVRYGEREIHVMRFCVTSGTMGVQVSMGGAGFCQITVESAKKLAELLLEAAGADPTTDRLGRIVELATQCVNADEAPYEQMSLLAVQAIESAFTADRDSVEYRTCEGWKPVGHTRAFWLDAKATYRIRPDKVATVAVQTIRE